jgi:exonuclease SbcD
MADCHLGLRRDHCNDFVEEYCDIIQEAIDSKVEFVLLAGDLFDKSAKDERILAHAISGLEQLKRACIPCIAIRGNHELTEWQENLDWLALLSERKLLTLLDSPNGKDRVYVEPLSGLRTYGLRWCGKDTPQAIRQMIDKLKAAQREDVAYTVLMVHSGIESLSKLSGAGGDRYLRQGELDLLRPHVDYLALGHPHKSFVIDNWIFNPGSPKIRSDDPEVRARDRMRSYYLVDIDTKIGLQSWQNRHRTRDLTRVRHREKKQFAV